MHFGNPAAQPGLVLHLAQLIHQEHELPITGTRDHPEFRVSVMFNNIPGIFDIPFSTHAFKISLPTLPIRWIGEHKIKLMRRKRIG